MFDLDKWQEILSTLQRHKLRTALTAFGVFWGIFMLVLLLGAGKGLEKGVYSQFSDTVTNSFFVWGGKTSLPYQGLNPGRYIDFSVEDIEVIRSQIPEAQYVNASMNLWGEFSISYGEKTGSFSVIGNYPDFIHIEAVQIIQGRYINARDMTERRKVAVIGQQVKIRLFGEHDAIGRYITIKGSQFQVVGIFAIRNPRSQERDPTEQIYLPLTTLQQTFHQGRDVYWFGIAVAENVSASSVEARVKALLKRRHKVAPDDRGAVGAWNMEKEFQKFQNLFRGITLFIWLVGTGTIIAGIVGVSNIMLIIVKERTKELGIRKALGATPFSIITLILQESIFITAVSGYMGLVAGVAVTEGISYAMNTFHLQSEFFQNPEVEFRVVVMAIAVLVMTGAIAGFIPARKAAAINPIEALRSE